MEQSVHTEALPVMETFYSIQGEGFYQGSAAFFIRLGGCDVGCVWCDVKESWDAGNHPMTSIENLSEQAAAAGCEMVIVTGGEPVMYNLEALTEQLKKQNLKTHLETSGVYPLTGQWDWICFSPKKFKTPDEGIYRRADELKVVVFHPSDLEWALEHASKVNSDCELFLQPEWSKEKQVLPLIVDFVKAHPEWKISLQLHKYLNVP